MTILDQIDLNLDRIPEFFEQKRVFPLHRFQVEVLGAEGRMDALYAGTQRQHIAPVY